MIWGTSINDLKWILLFNLLLWLVFSYFVKIYKTCGECVLYTDEIIILEKGEEHSIKASEIRSLILKYGGYKGEMHPLEILFTGSNFRDGTKNFLLIRDNSEHKIQIFIKNQNDLNFLISYLDKFKMRGSIVHLVKKRISFSP